MDMFSVAGFGMSLLQGFTEGAANRKQAGMMAGSVQDQINSLGEERSFINEAYGSSVKSATDTFGNSMASLSDKMNFTRAKSDLAYSGSIERKSEMNEENLFDALGSQLGQLKTDKSTGLGRIDATEKGLNTQLKTYQSQKNDYTAAETMLGGGWLWS